jgi:hypothetical protein
MLSLNLDAGEAALVTRILDLYLTELRVAAADGRVEDFRTQFTREAPLLKDILEQLVAQQAA